MKKYGWFLALLAVLVLPGCGERQLPPEQEEGVLTVSYTHLRAHET